MVEWGLWKCDKFAPSLWDGDSLSFFFRAATTAFLVVVVISGELGPQAKSARGEVGPLAKSAHAKSAREVYDLLWPASSTLSVYRLGVGTSILGLLESILMVE